MRRKIEFSVGNFYHIYNRGVEKRDIFLEEKDYYRFLDSLYLFNDENPFTGGRSSENREKIVEILAYCLLPNHFHLILTPVKEGGIVKFMRKLLTGYAMYFNEKYKRTGILFEGRYKAKIIENDTYFCHLTRYIHLNPLKLIFPEWEEKGINDWKKAISFLRDYRWSSLQFYLNNKNFLNLLSEDKIINHLEIKIGNEYLDFLKQWIPEDRPRKG